MIGHRLRTARAAAGLSLRDLESKIDNLVTAQALSKYEQDEMMPGSQVLIAIAKALEVSEDYLLSEQVMSLDGVEFRKKAKMSAKEQAQVEAQVLHLFERYLAVEELLGLTIEWDKPREAPYPVLNDVNEADRAARSLRQDWGLGLDPLPNLVELLEERGIKILSIMADKVDGLTAKVLRPNRTSLPVIVINSEDWAERKRFNLAHELGHLVMDIAPGLDCEKAAHRFAAAFLMPAESLWNEVGKHRTSVSMAELLQLKNLFGTSFQAITYRCKDLGIIGEQLFKSLFEIFKDRGWRASPFKEPGAISPEKEKPQRFERLCYRAVAEGALSEAKTAELLGISVRRLNERLDHPEAAVSFA
jgi:Zn-dependent peptidase ImmA (M78 family)